jgi:tRNA G18 (ribose-2'-O)-methylase SpoU
MVVILYNIRSVYNVASIFRTADAVGVKKIYLVGTTPTPTDRFGDFRVDFKKVALGAERNIAWQHMPIGNAAKLCSELKKEGFHIFAVEQSKKSFPYFKIEKKYKFEHCVLILGNEVRGLSASILKSADKVLEIPMRNAMVRQAHHPRHTGRGKESLNVSVAFGIVAYGLKFRK